MPKMDVGLAKPVAVSAQDASILSSTIDVSIESHLMGFMAEKSRRSMKKVKVG